MATSNDSTSPATVKENLKPISSRIAELNESRAELLNRIQSLKLDVQNWRSKLDTQVTIYRNELSELKKSLNVEVEQLRTEFQDLRTTLKQQQDDVAASLKNLGLQDASRGAPAPQDKEIIQSNDKDENDKAEPAGGAKAKEDKAEDYQNQPQVEECDPEVKIA